MVGALHEHRSARPRRHSTHTHPLFGIDGLAVVGKSDKSHHKTSRTFHRTNTLKDHEVRLVHFLSPEQAQKLRTRACAVVEEKTDIPMPQVLWRRRLVEKRQARGVDETKQGAADELVSGPLHIRAKTVIHIENAAIQRHHRNVAGGVLEVGEVLSLGMGEVEEVAWCKWDDCFFSF